MSKGPGQKHYQPTDHEHAAHQSEAARPRGERAATAARRPARENRIEHGGHPVEQAPKSPRKGQ
ncbi:MAG: hypothetical protein JO267_00240 [Alphaproteobacteria bacterium]|nr:hypothetical protein [Alphaproteobacteria bacterium]